MDRVDIAIIGGGPAGLTAALYASRGRANTAVFERALTGGQIITTSWVENYPGFPGGVTGQDIGDLMTKQAEEFGAVMRTFVPVESVTVSSGEYLITHEEGETMARALILATGAVPKKLGVPGEAEYTGRGVSWCATCDGAFFRDKTVCVVGGGDAAVEEAMFLTKFASKVYLIHRRDELRATKCIQEKCFANDRIEVKWSRMVKEVQGDGSRVTGVVLTATDGSPDETLPLDGVFEFVGIDPLSELVRDLCEVDAAGFVVTDPEGRTSAPGLYAAGDVTNTELKQVVTAAAKGASAAFEALRYLDEQSCMI